MCRSKRTNFLYNTPDSRVSSHATELQLLHIMGVLASTAYLAARNRVVPESVQRGLACAITADAWGNASLR